MSHPDPESEGWTAERIRLRERFHENAPTLEEPYAAAVRILNESAFPAKRLLLAHLVREIANGLPEVVTGRKFESFRSTKALTKLGKAWRREVPEPAPLTEPQTSPTTQVTISTPLARRVWQLVRDQESVPQTQHDKTVWLIDALRPGSQARRHSLEPIVREWVDVVAWFTKRAHLPRGTVSPQDENGDLLRRFQHFEDGLRGILDGYFEVKKEIDSVLVSSEPSPATLERLMSFMPGAELLRYFFKHERVEDPRWLPLLGAAGFFKHPPSAVVHEAAGGTSTWYPDWPASELLVRVASSKSANALVAEIALSVPDTENPRVHRDLADVALQLDPPLAARLAPRLRLWLRSSFLDFSRLDEKLGELTAQLAEGGEREAALGLLRALVGKSVRGPRGRPSSLDPYTLRRILDLHLGAIVLHLGMDALMTLCNTLVGTVRSWAADSEGANLAEDRSDVWRPAVERDGRFVGSDRDVLVGAVVAAAQSLAARGAATVATLVEYLESRRWWIFERVALFLLASTPEAPPDLVGSRLTDRDMFDSFDRTREYRMLLQRCFARVAVEQQAMLLGWIEAGPDRGVVRGFLERWADSEPTDTDVARECRRWQWRRLAAVQHDLPAGWQERWAALVHEFGAMDADAVLDLAPWPLPENPTVGPRVLDNERLLGTSIAQVAACVRIPWPERRLQPDCITEFQVEYLARHEPQRVAEGALHFEGCPPEVLAQLLWGLRWALSEGRAFAWPTVLRLASWVVNEAIVRHGATMERPPDSDGPSPDVQRVWRDPLSALIELLLAGLRLPSTGLSLDQRANLWPCIEAVAQSSDAETRAHAVDLIVLYRRWVVVRATDVPADHGVTPSVAAPEVSRALSAILAGPAAVEVHSAFGRWIESLAWLEHEWLRGNVDRVFPSDAVLWQAAWQAYADEHPYATKPSFELLRQVYEKAVETMKLLPMTGRERMGGSEPDREHAEVLANHLIGLYCYGVLEASDALVRRLFDRADGRLRFRALYTAGRECASAPRGPFVERLRALWQWRREAVEADPSMANELPAFGSWFVSSAFDDDWALNQLDFVLARAQPLDGDADQWEPVVRTVDVLRKLADLSAGMPGRAVRSLSLLAGRLTTRVYLSGSEIEVILAAALRDGDHAARTEAIKVFHRLGTLGFHEQELLPFSSDLDDPAAIPYFTWDDPMTVAEIRARLAGASEPERSRQLGQILREARDTDVWKFTTPDDVMRLWPQVERHLGKRRAFWQLMLDQWKEQGLLAG